MSDALRRVFLSYARADSLAFVDRLERDLHARQFQTWVDRHGLEGGEEWMEIIQQAIDDCLALVVVLSPAAVQSKFVRMEYRYASEIGKLVIPARFLATTTTPMDLRILQWVDFQSGYDEGLRHLEQALSRLKGPAAPPGPAKPILQPPPAPARAPTPPAKTAKQWLDEGNAHKTAKRYEQALAAYEQGIALDSNNASAYFNKGFVLNELQRHQEALAAYDRAIQLDPNNSMAHKNRGSALYHLKRYEEGLAAEERAIQLNPNNAFAWNGKGLALENLKRYQDALQAYEQAIVCNPKFGYAWRNKGDMLKQLGKKAEAEQAYQQARELGYTW